jgi:hypothetical protein
MQVCSLLGMRRQPLPREALSFGNLVGGHPLGDGVTLVYGTGTHSSF